MELVKEKIQMREQSCQSNLQITLEDDFNVPDSKADIDRIVTQDGRIEIVETNLLNGKLLVKGMLHFEMLYMSHEGNQLVHSIQGKIPFDEMVNMDSVGETDSIRVNWELEDVNSSLINSRKISVKALLMLRCCAWQNREMEIPTGVSGQEKLPCQYEDINVTELIVAKKDLLRIKENFHLPAGKANIDQILYSHITLQNMEVRAQERQILIRGEMCLFVLYREQSEEQKVVYFEGEQPFYSTVECEECGEKRLVQMDMELQSKEVQVKQDEDGEERGLEAELALNLDFGIYEEQTISYLKDMYSLEKELVPNRIYTNYRHLLFQNSFQKRINEQMALETPKNPIAQICHSRGCVQVDELEWREEGIAIEGSIEIKILYLGQQAEWPMGEVKLSVPFSHVMDGMGSRENKSFEVKPRLEQLAVGLLGPETVEVKLLLTMETCVYQQRGLDVIETVEEKEWDVEKFKQMPDMVGYLVQPEDDLWSVAKRFCTTQEAILECNQLKDKKLVSGEKILVIAQNQ